MSSLIIFVHHRIEITCGGLPTGFDRFIFLSLHTTPHGENPCCINDRYPPIMIECGNRGPGQRLTIIQTGIATRRIFLLADTDLSEPGTTDDVQIGIASNDRTLRGGHGFARTVRDSRRQPLERIRVMTDWCSRRARKIKLCSDRRPLPNS